MNHLLTTVENRTLTITINRESKLNALNIELLGELSQVLHQYEHDESVRSILLTGSGSKAFAAGADIAEFANFSTTEARQLSASGHRLFDRIEQFPKPILAAVNGFALGGGCELVMACHLRVAATNARFGQPEINLGVIPGYGGTQRLVRLIGKTKALELLLVGDPIKADAALALGLVNAVVEPADLLPTCYALLEKINDKSPLAVAAIIRSVNAQFESSNSGFQAEIEAFAAAFGTEDFREGTDAFLNKRKANFTGK